MTLPNALIPDAGSEPDRTNALQENMDELDRRTSTNPFALVIAGGARIFSGAAAPAISARTGDFYLRTGTPATLNQRIYICTTASTATTGAWTGLV